MAKLEINDAWNTRNGNFTEVDALVTVGNNNTQVFTMEGEDHAYRVLIESMNEGVPVQISLRALARKEGSRATIGMVVTDMTEARQTEELLRTLSHRVMQAQEAERRWVAQELHDHITQMVCATLIRSQTLANQLSAREDGLKQEAIKLREMLGETAEEVERISRGMRPSVLEELGLSVVLCVTTKEFAKRTGVPVKLSCVELATRLPAETELTLYRILQEALNNVEQHASAHHVTVRLTKQDGVVQLVIHDDGIGFDPENHPAIQEGKFALGLLCMRERATYSGGTLKVKSVRNSGMTMFPMATSDSLRIAATMLVASSGRLVPAATMVRRMTASESPKSRAMATAPETNICEPSTKIPRQMHNDQFAFLVAVFFTAFWTSFSLRQQWPPRWAGPAPARSPCRCPRSTDR